MVRGEATSCQDFAASVPATRGSLPPLDPASLKLYSGGWSSGSANRAVGELTQNRAARFHLNFVPRQYSSTNLDKTKERGRKSLERADSGLPTELPPLNRCEPSGGGNLEENGRSRWKIWAD